MKHPFIEEYVDTFIYKGLYKCVITNYYPGGNLTKILRSGKKIDEKLALKYFSMILLGVH